MLKVPSQAVVDRRLDELPKELSSNPNVDKNKAFARVVFKLDDGKAKPVPVSIGTSDVTHTVIVAGLSEGEKIITGPFKILTSLKPDQKVVEEGAKKPDDKTPSQARNEKPEERRGS